MAVSLLQLLLAILIGWLLLVLLSSKYDLSKYGVSIAPLLLLWQSSRLVAIYNFLTRKPRAWKIIGKISAIAGLALFLSYPFILIGNVILHYLGRTSAVLGSNPLNPMSTQAILIFAVTMFISLFFHELSHGIMLRTEGIEVASSGFIIVAVIMTLFVRPAKEFYTASKKIRLRVLTAGSMANLIIVLLIAPLLFYNVQPLSPWYGSASGALVVNVRSNSPADKQGLVPGDVIIAVKEQQFGVVTNTYNITSADALVAELRNIAPGTAFILSTLQRDIEITGTTPPADTHLIGGSYIGVAVHDYQKPLLSFLSVFLPYDLQVFLEWMFNINLIIGLVNLLPMPYTDGEKILQMLLEGKPAAHMLKVTTEFIAGGLLLFNILLTL